MVSIVHCAFLLSMIKDLEFAKILKVQPLATTLPVAGPCHGRLGSKETVRNRGYHPVLCGAGVYSSEQLPADRIPQGTGAADTSSLP